MGYVSFDEALQNMEDLYCAHLSTLRDVRFRHLNDTDTKDPGVDLGNYQDYILAYALVLTKVVKTENNYQRVGLAEVNYKWIKNGTKIVIKLF